MRPEIQEEWASFVLDLIQCNLTNPALLNPASTGKIIFITNVDSGYGQELAKFLINRGARVIAGAKDPMSSSLLQLREILAYQSQRRNERNFAQHF